MKLLTYLNVSLANSEVCKVSDAFQNSGEESVDENA